MSALPPGFAADAAALGARLSELQLEQLTGFVTTLEKWNQAFNLLSRRDIKRVWTRHVLDSLSLCGLLQGDEILDIGSGGGFPGLPLAIANPERTFTLVDRHQRKCRFLEQLAAEQALSNVAVRCEDAHVLAAEGSCGYSTIVSRAVLPVTQLWDLALQLLAPGGRLLAMSSTRNTPSAGHAEPSAGHAEPSAALPAGSRCQQVLIAGLAQPHEVVIIDRGQQDG